MVERPPDWIEYLKFGRLEHREFVFECWRTDEPDALVKKLSETITEEFRIRKSLLKDNPHYVSPLKWLKPVCYNAILTCLHYDLFDHLRARNEQYDRLRRGPQIERSIFMIGLVGIFAHDVVELRTEGARKVQIPTLTTEKYRARMSGEMWWGFRHYVTPDELVAFNRQYPLHKANPSKPRDYILDEFHDTIISRRAEGEWLGIDVEDKRGGYPEKIEKAVEARLNKQWKALRRRTNAADPNWD